MPDVKDLTGYVFGSWVVVGRGENSKYREVVWNCKCKCGSVRLVRSSSLRNGTSWRCRKCANQNSSPPHPYKDKPKHDLSAMRFGKLTATSPVLVNKQWSWNCRCDCGRFIVVLAFNLRSGNVKSCGCLRMRHRRCRSAYADGGDCENISGDNDMAIDLMLDEMGL